MIWYVLNGMMTIGIWESMKWAEARWKRRAKYRKAMHSGTYTVQEIRAMHEETP